MPAGWFPEVGSQVQTDLRGVPTAIVVCRLPPDIVRIRYRGFRGKSIIVEVLLSQLRPMPVGNR
jgi:hypothetical protein